MYRRLLAVVAVLGIAAAACGGICAEGAADSMGYRLLTKLRLKPSRCSAKS